MWTGRGHRWRQTAGAITASAAYNGSGAQSREEVAMRLPLHAQLVRADPRLTRFRICAGAVRSLVQMSHREVHRSHRHMKKMGSGQFELSHFWFVLPGSLGHNSSRRREGLAMDSPGGTRIGLKSVPPNLLAFLICIDPRRSVIGLFLSPQGCGWHVAYHFRR